MLRLRPFRGPDAKEIITWTSDPEEFYKWSAGIMGDYPVSEKRFLETFSAREDNPRFFPFTEFQGRGIGTAAMEFAKSFYSDWESFTLVTPVDKSQNVKFYTEKCGFDIESEEMDGNVKVYRFVLKRTDGSHGAVLG